MNINNPYIEGMVTHPIEMQLIKANSAYAETAFINFNIFVSFESYDKRDDFDFGIVNFPFLDGVVPCAPSYGVYICQLIWFAKVSSHLADFNARNITLTSKLLQYRYYKL